MHVCMCMCVCMCVYIYIYIYIHINMYMFLRLTDHDLPSLRRELPLQKDADVRPSIIIEYTIL